jgi:hypothetical protein
MALRDWFSQRTPLQLALERGTKPGADLAEELERIDDYKIKSQADADATRRSRSSRHTKGFSTRPAVILSTLTGYSVVASLHMHSTITSGLSR